MKHPKLSMILVCSILATGWFMWLKHGATVETATQKTSTDISRPPSISSLPPASSNASFVSGVTNNKPIGTDVLRMIRRCRVLEGVPEREQLGNQILALDPKDYPHELATIIGDSQMGKFSDLEIVKFSKTDNPEAVKALIALAESHPELWRENFQIAYTLARMTNSTNLIPALAGGLDSPVSKVVSSCHSALIQMPVLETARAFVERAKTAEATIPPGWEFSRRDFLLEDIQELRNPELIPYLRRELEAATDPEIAKRLRRAIKGTELGWPPVAQEEDWRSIGLE